MKKKIVEAILAKDYDKAKKLIEKTVKERLFAAFMSETFDGAAQSKAGNKVTSTDDESGSPEETKGSKIGAGEGIPDEYEDDGGGPKDVKYGEVVTTEADVAAQSDNVHPVAGDEPEDEMLGDGGQDGEDADYGDPVDDRVKTESDDSDEDDEEGDDDEEEDDEEDMKSESDDSDEDYEEGDDDEEEEDEDKNETFIVRFNDGFRLIDENGSLLVNETFDTAAEAADFMNEYMSPEKLKAYKMKTRGKAIAVSRLSGERKHATTIKKAADAQNKLSKAKEKLAHRQIRLQQREKAKSKLPAKQRKYAA